MFRMSRFWLMLALMMSVFLSFSYIVAIGTVAAVEGLEGVFSRPTATLNVDKETVQKGDTVNVSWKGANGTASLNGDKVSLEGSSPFVLEETSSFTFKVSKRFRSAQESITVTVSETPAPTPDPEPTPDPGPEPQPGFSLSAIGIGSAFEVDDKLSAASRDHDIGEFLKSQNGKWLLITDEILAEKHPVVLDQWVAILAESGKKAPAVIWTNQQGKVLGIDEVAGKDKVAILELAKAQVPATRMKVVIQGTVRELGLLPPKQGARYAGPSVSKILKPLAAADCPSVDLRSQVLYYKNQSGGTCVLNAFAGACEAAIYVSYGVDNVQELSPYFLANLSNGYNGTYAQTAAELIQKWGNLPFDAVRPYGQLPSDWKSKAPDFKCIAVYGPPDRDSVGYLRAALNRGYIACAGISVGSGFNPDSNGYISYARGAGRYVNHEIRVVAWDQAKRRFGIANSWGKSWGISGFAWLDEKFFEADTDMWVVVGMVASNAYTFPKPYKEVSYTGKSILTIPVEAEIVGTCPEGICPKDMGNASPCRDNKCQTPTYAPAPSYRRRLFRW